jgi:GTP-binding protein YchF
MSLSIGIVGLPNVGKSTLFNALTKKSVLAANYPFATIDPSVGVVAVPDVRLQKLAEFSKSAKPFLPVEFVDIAGLVKGASEGEGLGNQFLTNIRETDAIAEVVRIFEDSDIIHVDGKIDPLKDIEVINLELILADLQTVTKRLSNLKSNLKKAINRQSLKIKHSFVLKKCFQTASSRGLLHSMILKNLW